MTWPAVQVKTNVDAAGDDPKQARSDFAGNVDKFNQLQAHVSSYIQGLLDDADAGAARTTLGAISTAGVTGDILYAPGANTWARLAKGADGEALVLASGIPSWGDAGATIVSKTADETVNNSTTLQDDNHLAFAMAANITYAIDMVLLLNSTGDTPDFKLGWTVPSGCVMFWEGYGSNAWGFGGTTLKGAGDTDITGSVSGTGGTLYKLFVRNGANAGNLQLRWAQNTADASDSKVLKHSHLIIRNLGAT